jgi:hypothetical protein
LKNPKISKWTPYLLQIAHYGFDLGNLPAKNRELCRREILHFRDPDQDPVRIQYHGEAVILDEAKAQDTFVECPRLLGIPGRDKRNDVGGTEH